MDDRYVSIATAAEIFDYSKITIYRRISEMRKIKKYADAFVGSGKSLRVSLFQLEKYLKGE